jgi:hypothetical protein
VLLDEKIENGTFTDEDFKNSVLTTFGKTKCFNCGWEGYTLVMFTADYYTIVPGLEAKKSQQDGKARVSKCVPTAVRNSLKWL